MAISLVVAKKCLELTMKEYPRPKGYAAYKPGHPGTAKAREEYYRQCVANDGNLAAPMARRSPSADRSYPCADKS